MEETPAQHWICWICKAWAQDPAPQQGPIHCFARQFHFHLSDIALCGLVIDCWLHYKTFSILPDILILPDIFWIKGNLNMEHPTDVFLSMNDQIKICVTKNCLSKKKYCSIHFCFWLLQTWILHAECKLCLSLLCHELFWFNYPHSAKFCSMLSQESVKNHKNTNFNTI